MIEIAYLYEFCTVNMIPHVYQKATKKRPEGLKHQASGRFQFLYVYQLATCRTFSAKKVRFFAFLGHFPHFFLRVRGVIQAYLAKIVPFYLEIGVNSPENGPKS